jgi:DNA-binding protein HU-beta
MQTDDATATAWLDGIVETIYESLKEGESVTLRGFGSFYVRPERNSWVFRFNPSQRLRALFGWSSSYKGERWRRSNPAWSRCSSRSEASVKWLP